MVESYCCNCVNKQSVIEHLKHKSFEASESNKVLKRKIENLSNYYKELDCVEPSGNKFLSCYKKLGQLIDDLKAESDKVKL